MTDDDLIPRKLRGLVASLEPTPLVAPSPLPALAVTWYTMGGCWSLALALREETGLPIELYYLRGRPSHAYVVDGDDALDARGRNDLRLVRLGAERLEQVDAEELMARLTPVAPDIAELVDDAEVREAATRAARLVLNG